MANDQNELRCVNWSELFSFTHVFRCFRMAIHPSKLVLALAAILLIYFGGRAMDWVWRVGDSYVYTAGGSGGQGEIQDYFQKSPEKFDRDKQDLRDRRPQAAASLLAAAHAQKASLGAWMTRLNSAPGDYRHLADAVGTLLSKANADAPPKIPDSAALMEEAKKDWKRSLSKARDVFSEEVDRIEDLLDKGEDNARDAIKADKALDNEDKKDRAYDLLDEHVQIALQALTERKASFDKAVEDIRGKTIFASLLEYEGDCLKNAISAVRCGNFTGGWSMYRRLMRDKGITPAGGWPASTEPPPAPPTDSPGFVFSALMAVHGVCWLVSEHWLYAVIFLVFALAVWALFGGAIHRIAALHAAREEKISITQALKFAVGKFLSFFTAPLIPLGLIVFLGGLLAVGGLIANLWGVGAVLMGILFFLAILLGLAVAFLLIGLVAGFPLMYPTIAVEGSDSFDAFSRSFAYVFQKPWRAALYGGVALVYGTVCYLFVRMFAFVALAGTHTFVKWGVWQGGQTLSSQADKLDVLWQAPTFDALHGPMNWAAMSGMEKIGAWFIAVWVYLVVGLVASFLLTYFASASTMIYYLLRRKVDATDLDDVYLEEEEEAPAETEGASEPKAPAEDESDKDETPEDEDKTDA